MTNQNENDQIKMEQDEDSLWEMKRIAASEYGRRSFWAYANTYSPNFFTDEKWFLKKIADSLQGLFEQKLINPKTNKPYSKLMINIQPQIGKSRLLSKFMEWALGKDENQRIIYTSYNNTNAEKFSRYVRNTIDRRRENPKERKMYFSDYFPNVYLDNKNKSVGRWALKDQHFNFLAAGVGGSVTGEGGSIIIVDDPIKNAEEATTESVLDKIWDWYTGTLLSRVSAEALDPIEIIIMTRWTDKDLCGRLLKRDTKGEWLQIKMEAFSEENYKMNKKYIKNFDKLEPEESKSLLSPKTFKYDRYLQVKLLMNEMIFYANYHQKTFDKQNALYKEFKTYTYEEIKNIKFDVLKIKVDLADKGGDYFFYAYYGLHTVITPPEFPNETYAYIFDMYMSDEGYEVTIEEVAKRAGKSSASVMDVEDNFGGMSWEMAIRNRIIYYGNRFITFKHYHESENKEAKINQYSHIVSERIIMPEDWKNRFPEIYRHLTEFQRVGKSKHDDPEDVLSNIAKDITESFGGYNDFVRLLGTNNDEDENFV